MQAVTRLCSRCILLHNGQIKLDGPSTQVANAYLNTGVTTTAAREWPDITSAPGDEIARLCGVRVRSGKGDVVDSVDIRETVGIELEYEILTPGHKLLPHFALRNQDGTVLFVAVDVDPEWRGRSRPPGRYVSKGWIPGNLMAEGFFYVQAVIMSLDPEIVHMIVEEAVAFRVVDDLTAANTSRGDYGKPMPGDVRPLLEWTTSLVPQNGGIASDKQFARASGLARV
jgi:lipopolysaccharide transport system ATP-binding protein